MLTAYINDKPLQLPPLATMGDALAAREITPQGKAAALNGTVIPPDLWATTRLADGDRITVFRAFYGG